MYNTDAHHFINGKVVISEPSECWIKNTNPSNGKVIGSVPFASTEILNSAIEAASEAYKSWRNVSRVKRADLFFQLSKLVERDQQKLAHLISLETGKSLNEANAEVVEALHMCQWVSAQGRERCGDWMASEVSAKDAYVIRKPKGVVVSISPWNFPLAIGSFWTTGPALVEGNVVVHKPSEMTPLIATYVSQLYLEAGFPPGVYNVVHGDAVAGETLVRADNVKTILFTGSAEVGMQIRKICAAKYDRNCSTETGSKSATILFEDGNQNLAIEAMVASAFKLSGQRCVSSSRLLIQESVYDDFCNKFVEAVKTRVTVGDPFEDPAPYCGPIISHKQLNRIKHYNSLAFDGNQTYKVEVLLQGEHLDRDGYYLTPHVYKTTWSDASFLKEEVFGPHVALIPFKDVHDAVRIYNDTEYGLAVGAITDDFRKMKILRENCNAGMIYMNGGSVAAESHLPFGGVGRSGNGHKTAAGTFRTVTDEVAVTVNYEEGITWAQGLR